MTPTTATVYLAKYCCVRKYGVCKTRDVERQPRADPRNTDLHLPVADRCKYGDGPWSGISEASALSYTPTAGDVNRFLRLLVSVTDDGEGLPASTTSQAATAPSLVTNAAPVIEEGSALDITASPVTLHASDADGNTLTWTISRAPSHGIASVSATGLVTFSVYPSCAGMDDFTLTVTDGHSSASIILRPPAGACRFYADDLATQGQNNGTSWKGLSPIYRRRFRRRVHF